MSLVEFLLDRIAEDEDIARACTAGPWAAVRPATTADVVDTEHIERHGPARVLAECRARRELIASVASLETPTSPAAVELGDEVLRALAHPYRDHPSFDPAWAL